MSFIAVTAGRCLTWLTRYAAFRHCQGFLFFKIYISFVLIELREGPHINSFLKKLNRFGKRVKILFIINCAKKLFKNVETEGTNPSFESDKHWTSSFYFVCLFVY